MKKYCEMSREELLDLKKELDREFDEIKAEGLALDMSRGKPAPDQLDLSMKMMEVLAGDADLKCETGVDCRNYGVIDGIPEAKRLLGEMSEVEPENIIIYGNSSLNVMFDTIARSYSHGVMGNTPWCKLDKVKFLCPVPGYDRHFRITEFFGIEMINIPMSPEGPDMDMVEKYVNEDPAVKGIWCVPKYSNPQGYTYSEETVKRFAHLKPAAPDFRIYWDNAYSIHHLYDDNQDFLLEILDECAKAGNPDIVYKFTSTSKVSFPGSGIAAVAASKANLDDFRKYMTVQTIGHDKLNQLRHVRFFKDINGLHEHMKKHADILRPKFELVLATLDKELNGLGIGEWTKPHGGYFISFDSMEGCAKAIVAKAKEAGVVMTGAGATYPYGKDPKDSNIRIAPSYPSVEELGKAAEVFVLCVKLVSVEKLLENKLFSTVFLTGKGFERQDWATGFMKLACNRRRVFVENVLFSKGAAIKARDYMVQGTEFPYVFVCEGRLKAEVALKVMRAGKEIMLAVASYGDNWYESKSSLELILDGQKEIEFLISHLDSRKKRAVSVPLTGFPDRPEKTTRIRMNIGFTDENTMAVVIRDMGFGELFPASDAVIRQEVIL